MIFKCCKHIRHFFKFRCICKCCEGEMDCENECNGGTNSDSNSSIDDGLF